MVRTTIACARCRRSKVKCVHEGTSPCRGCVKAGTTADCVLSGPVLKKRRLSSVKDDKRAVKSGSSERPTSAPRPWIKLDSQEARAGSSAPPELDPGFTPLVLNAAHVFAAQFPELGFLHMPSFSLELNQLDYPNTGHNGSQGANSRTKLRALGSAIVALCAPLMQGSCDREGYASFARDSVSPADLPDKNTVQTLLVLAMYEWGNGRAYRAWVYSGMATRMMQLLCAMHKPADLTDLQLECLNRTFWSCYIMDRLVVCGKPQPLTLPLDSMEIHWPVGQRDFAFGQASLRAYPKKTNANLPCDDMDDYYRLLVQGFDIWAQILQWVTGGGRRRPDLCPEGGAIWEGGSAWRGLYDRLQGWRGSHGRRIRFPDTAVEVHVSLGHGQAFAYINLVYYLSLLFLGREYLPFLPTPTSEPCGPTDPPLLPRAPPNFWADRAAATFSSATQITDLLRRMDAASTPFLTPFAGFCAFSAATMNVYVTCFPRMNLGRSVSSAADVEANLGYLGRFRERWGMGEGWWGTVGQTRVLYERASRDGGRYRGKTRDDFEGLHTSMHDSSGISPAEAAETPSLARETPRSTGFVDQGSAGYQVRGEPHVAAAMSLQDLAQPQPHPPPPPQPHGSWVNSPAFPDVTEWNDIWPLWGEQVEMPFGLDGVPWDGSGVDLV